MRWPLVERAAENMSDTVLWQGGNRSCKRYWCTVCTDQLFTNHAAGEVRYVDGRTHGAMQKLGAGK